MGLVSRLLSFAREDASSVAVVDRGGNDNRTLDHYSDVGDDSQPLAGDYVQTVSQSGSGRESSCGYNDPLNAQTAQPGEKRIYARDADTGEQVIELWLKNDGSITITNEEITVVIGADGSMLADNQSGSFELEAGGDFVVNGATIDTSGKIISPTGIESPSVLAAGKELAGHIHMGDGDPSSPGPTGPNL